MNTSYRYRDFEDYLSQLFAEGDGKTCLDDEFPDAFDEWLCDLQPDDYIRYGNMYANLCKIQIHNQYVDAQVERVKSVLRTGEI